MTPDAFDRLKPALACPRCKGDLDFAPTRARCEDCDRDYPIGDGQIRFVDAPPPADDLDSLKHRLKKLLGASYYTLFRPLLSPSYPFSFARFVRRNLDAGAIAVDLGSGNVRRLPGLYTLDRMPYAEVDIVCDMRLLPFRPGGVDAFVSNVVLEHVPEIDRVVAEITRATRTGGRGIHVIPFLYPFHASPDDFQRYTHMGARGLFPGWRVAAQFPASGPFTLFNAMTAEVVSILLGFGRDRLRSLVYLGTAALLAPLKFLDVAFVGRRAFLSVAPSILTVLDKPDGPAGQASQERPGAEST